MNELYFGRLFMIFLYYLQIDFRRSTAVVTYSPKNHVISVMRAF